MTNVQEQDKRKGGRPPIGRVRKLSKSVTMKFSKPSYEALRLRARKANRKLNVKFEGMEKYVSPRDNSTQQYEQGYHKNEQEPSMLESNKAPWNGISSIGLFAPANAQTFEQFPKDESSKKKKKKRRRGFSL